jgi:hypothetical protein
MPAAIINVDANADSPIRPNRRRIAVAIRRRSVSIAGVIPVIWRRIIVGIVVSGRIGVRIIAAVITGPVAAKAESPAAAVVTTVAAPISPVAAAIPAPVSAIPTVASTVSTDCATATRETSSATTTARRAPESTAARETSSAPTTATAASSGKTHAAKQEKAKDQDEIAHVEPRF